MASYTQFACAADSKTDRKEVALLIVFLINKGWCADGIWLNLLALFVIDVYWSIELYTPLQWREDGRVPADVLSHEDSWMNWPSGKYTDTSVMVAMMSYWMTLMIVLRAKEYWSDTLHIQRKIYKLYSTSTLIHSCHKKL